MRHFETKAPVAPWARVMPADCSSWFMSNVNVPSPLSNAPSPSGMPTMRYGLRSGLVLTVSPVVKRALVVMPAAVGTR